MPMSAIACSDTRSFAVSMQKSTNQIVFHIFAVECATSIIRFTHRTLQKLIVEVHMGSLYRT